MNVILIDALGPVKGFNSGLAYISAVLSCTNNTTVKVIDLNNNPYHSEKRLQQINEIKPDVIGVSVKSHTLKSSVEIVEKFKLSQAVLIAGGPEVTLEKEKFFNENQIFDYCFIGEAERGFPEFIDYLNHKIDINEIRGLYYRRNDGRITMNEQDIIENLDELPFPDYSVFDSVSLIKDKYPLVTSRGCPYQCTYCAVGEISGRHWRFRNPENIVEELVYAKKKYGTHRFEVTDDNFTLDIERAKRICSLIIKKGLGLKWSCINGIRADRVDDELLKLMHISGCEEIWFGIESLNQEVFKKVNKGERTETITKAVELAKKNDIAVSGFFIIGLPDSTYQKDKESLEKSKKLKLKEGLWSLAIPLPHTEMWDWVEKNAKIIRDYREVSFFKLSRPVFETTDYPEKERIKMFYKANIISHCYSSLFSEKITSKDILKFIFFLLRYDFFHIFIHIKKISFGKYHRKYLKEIFRRLKQ